MGFLWGKFHRDPITSFLIAILTIFSFLDLDIENEGEAVASKLQKEVDETYVMKKDEEDEEKDKKKTTKKKTKKFLSAAKWALVYRALKPLLRPCGDLGEGRFDFYHRSISKAVRKR